ncbi:hypothetical protein [Flindersiella endophytica]
MRRHKRDGVVGQVMPYAHRAQKKAAKAQKKAGPVVEQAWDRVAPAVESAKDRLGPAVEEARDKAEAAVVTAMEVSEPYRKEAMKRGTAAWLALRGDLQAPAPKKRHWVRNILLLGGIGGSAFVAYKILRNGTASQWMPKQADAPEQSESESETTPPASSGATTTGLTGKHKDDEATPVNGPGKSTDKQPASTGTRSTANRTPRSATDGKDASTS